MTIPSSESDVEKSIVHGNESTEDLAADADKTNKQTENGHKPETYSLVVMLLLTGLYAFHPIHCGCSQP